MDRNSEVWILPPIKRDSMRDGLLGARGTIAYVCVCVRKIPTNKCCLIVLAMLQIVRLVEQLSPIIRSRGWGHVFYLVMGKVV